jgi:putative colanic acid biosynthesis UDP-glucose lipid carrier transferase
MTAIVIAAIFVPALYNRGLYSPVALVKLKSQIRNILGLWTIAFLAFASVAFALKVGSDLSRGAVLLFGIIGLIAILFHRVLWRRATENDNVNTLALRTNGGQPPSGPASC